MRTQQQLCSVHHAALAAHVRVASDPQSPHLPLMSMCVYTGTNVRKFYCIFSNAPCLKDDILPEGWILLFFAVLHTNIQGRKYAAFICFAWVSRSNRRKRGAYTCLQSAPQLLGCGFRSSCKRRAAGGGQGQAGPAPGRGHGSPLHLRTSLRHRMSLSTRSPPCPHQKLGLNHSSYDAEHATRISATYSPGVPQELTDIGHAFKF